jgi:SAM-dependent methyltransferase
MGRTRTFVILLGAAAAAAAVVRHGRDVAKARTVPGGILIGDAAVYDTVSGVLLGSFFKGITADVSTVAPDGARVLEVGCGPGHLSIRLARRGFDVTGLDLDPAMIERARVSAEGAGDHNERRPSFVVGDVASLPFPDGSFDLVVSTFSMHHWSDPSAGLAEIGRVLHPGARALIWDFRSGARPHLIGPRHAHVPDPIQSTYGSALRLVIATPWRWPWRFSLAQRIELVRADGAPSPSGTQWGRAAARRVSTLIVPG